MTYIQQWEQMREKVRNLEQERQTQLILAPHNAYGFKLNINHPLIRPKWEAFMSAKGLGQYGMTDDLRREFEETVLASKNALSRSSSTLVQWSTSSSVWLTPLQSRQQADGYPRTLDCCPVPGVYPAAG